MIIKSLRHTQFLSNYSVNYVFDGVSDEPENRWIVFQNITTGFDRHSIIQEFNSNAQYLTKAKNRKRCYRYHEVLAFSYSNSNSQDLSREKLQRIANKYLKLRDPQGLSKALCVPHLDKGSHYHIHILLSSNFIESSRSGDMRMSNEHYYNLRRGIERWMLQEFPELHRSTVYLEEKEIEQLLPEKYRSERRLMQLEKSQKNRNYTKDKVAERIKGLLAKSNTLEQFETRINNEPEYATYSRNGQFTGVVHNNKKYRLKNLIPLYHENFLVLKRMQELERINNREHSQERER
ncbi:MAG: relaxase/mobilization nuclease domain-containing protein [Flavobacteriaceae bacterium]|nr:MAG: relaxase/mobilization nuclease domain-containing protein [Flavobacteriaceae bacterium]